MTANELQQMHQGALRDLAKSLGVKVGRMTREQMAAAIVEHREGTHTDGFEPTLIATGDDCTVCYLPSAADRRRILATIATECPGQDVAGVTVIDDALRIDFVSGAALLVGADGTLSWEAAAEPELCTCGHEPRWHADYPRPGRGLCEFDGECPCTGFVS